MVKIRLQRLGARNQPFYRIVVADQRQRRSGRPVETLGTYNPLTDPETVVVKRDRFDYWMSQGAQPTEPVRMIVLGEKLKKAKTPRKQIAQKPETNP